MASARAERRNPRSQYAWLRIATAGSGGGPCAFGGPPALGANTVAGRAFNSGDLHSAATVVVVNEYFVNEILQGRNAIGRRIRYTTRYGQRAATGQPQGLARSAMREPGQWYQIVGVVQNLGMDTTRDAFAPGKGPGVYHPLTPDAMGSGGSCSVRIAFSRTRRRRGVCSPAS